MLHNGTLKETQEEFFNERNSLRRFFVGLIATTFGVLVALHPHDYVSTASRWCYVISVIANAISLFFFIGSLFGRYRMLYEKGINEANQLESAMHGKDYKPIKLPYAERFSIFAKLGLFLYICAIVVACLFIVLEVLGK